MTLPKFDVLFENIFSISNIRIVYLKNLRNFAARKTDVEKFGCLQPQ